MRFLKERPWWGIQPRAKTYAAVKLLSDICSTQLHKNLVFWIYLQNSSKKWYECTFSTTFDFFDALSTRLFTWFVTDPYNKIIWVGYFSKLPADHFSNQPSSSPKRISHHHQLDQIILRYHVRYKWSISRRGDK